MNTTGRVLGRHRRTMWMLALVFAGSLTWLIPASMGAQDKEKDAVLERLIAGLHANDKRTRNQSVDGILTRRKAEIERLIPLVGTEGKELDETQTAAVYVLGQLRAVEAIPALSKVMATEQKEGSSDISRYDFAVHTALANMGRPVVPAMIENIETSDSPTVMKKASDILYDVLGGRLHTLELLGKLKARAKDEKVAKRIEAAIEHVTRTYSGEDPLY